MVHRVLTSLITFAMGGFSKVRVDFGQDSVVDFDQLLYNLQSEYGVGFCAVSSVDGGIALFVQKHEDVSTRMALGKVKKVCSKAAHVVKIASFDMIEGTIIESFGDFRPRGRRGGVHVEKVTDEVNEQTSKDEKILMFGGKAYACREIPLSSNK